MSRLHCQRIGDKLMMGTLENSLLIVFLLVFNQAAAIPGVKAGTILSGQPRNLKPYL